MLIKAVHTVVFLILLSGFIPFGNYLLSTLLALYEAHKEVKKRGNRQPYQRMKASLLAYRAILNQWQVECPAPQAKEKEKKRGSKKVSD